MVEVEAKPDLATWNSYVAAIWGCTAAVGFLACVNAWSKPSRMNGAVPAVGGYSNTRQSESTTVGIVTQLTGAAFSISHSGKTTKALKVGSGLHLGQQIWVEPSARLSAVTLSGDRLVFAGPAVAEMIAGDQTVTSHRLPVRSVVRLAKGSFELQSSTEGRVSFESIYMNGDVDGECAIWISDDHLQVLGMKGNAKVWHPFLPEATTLVPAGYYTESFEDKKYLQAKRPVLTDEEKAKSFLARFGEEDIDNKIDFDETFRKLASEENEESKPDAKKYRRSRSPSEVSTPADKKVLLLLREHLKGHDMPDDDVDDGNEAPLAEIASSDGKHHAYQKHSHHGLMAHSKPSFEIRSKGNHQDAEGSALLEKISKKNKPKDDGEAGKW